MDDVITHWDGEHQEQWGGWWTKSFDFGIAKIGEVRYDLATKQQHHIGGAY